MSLSSQQLSLYLPKVRELIQEWASSSSSNVDDSATKPSQVATERDVVVAFRTRPTLPGEAEMLASQVQEEVEKDKRDPEYYLCTGISVQREQPGTMIAHLPSMKWNGPTVAQKSFQADYAFGPLASNEHVYDKTVIQSDMVPLVISGGVACILAYGQTGTGKTYTMSALELAIARDLFAEVEEKGQKLLQSMNRSGTEAFEITVTFLEVVGKTVYDLSVPHSDTESEKKVVNVSENKLGKVIPDVQSTLVNSAADLQSVIEKCLSYRRTAVTTRNAASSRSHALLTIRVKNLVVPELEDGEFILVDLAGSERYQDNKAHSRQLMEESKDNNKALLALKECVRARAKAAVEDGFVHIPYRTSKLTWLLKPIFDLEETRQARTVVIAHVSPHIQDSSHSVNTLSYTAPFRVLPPRRPPAPYNPEDPRTWDHAASITWLETSFREAYETRRRANYKNQAQEAKKSGKKLKPLPPPPSDRPCIINLEKFCPPPFGGIFLAKMYGAEWVQKCLDARNEEMFSGAKDKDEFMRTLKKDAFGLYVDFSQMLLYARTKSRNAILRSRKIIDYENIAREAPVTEREDIIDALSTEEKVDFLTEYPQQDIGEEIYKRVRLAGALGDNVARYKIRDQVYTEYLEKFREGRARREKEREMREKAKEVGDVKEEVEINFGEIEV